MKSFLTKRLCNPKWWFSQVITLLLIVVVITAVSLYQQRNMASDFAPELVAVTLSGERYDLSEQYKQGPVLVYFWGSWCGICSLTSPAISDIAQDVAGSGSSVLTVALSSGDSHEVQAYLDKHNYSFTTLNDNTGEISRRWGVAVTPSIFYLNTKGKIVLVSSGLSSEWGMRIKLWLARFL
ncbi:MAG: protein disulfide oxidoreductase [Pontibacterium sp.]